MSFYFNQIFPNVRLVTGSSASEMFEQIFRVGKDDVFIGISFPGYSKRTVKAIDYAKERGATVIAITDSAGSPLAAKCDHLLLARSDMASFVDSLVASLEPDQCTDRGSGNAPPEGKWERPTPSWKRSGTNMMYMKRMRRILSDETGI